MLMVADPVKITAEYLDIHSVQDVNRILERIKMLVDNGELPISIMRRLNPPPRLEDWQREQRITIAKLHNQRVRAANPKKPPTRLRCEACNLEFLHPRKPGSRPKKCPACRG